MTRPAFPTRFGSIQDARAHCHVFFPWYTTEVERRHILRVLETTGGNLTVAAKRLGIDRNTLRSRMQQWQGHGARMGSA